MILMSRNSKSKKFERKKKHTMRHIQHISRSHPDEHGDNVEIMTEISNKMIL